MGTKLSCKKSIKPKNAKRKISKETTYNISKEGKVTKRVHKEVRNVGNGKGNK